MKLKLSDSFVRSLENQVEFISRDDVTTAKRFAKQLISLIKEISKRPLSFRKSIYFDDIKFEK